MTGEVPEMAGKRRISRVWYAEEVIEPVVKRGTRGDDVVGAGEDGGGASRDGHSQASRNAGWAADPGDLSRSAMPDRHEGLRRCS